jgi:hypothetical protein
MLLSLVLGIIFFLRLTYPEDISGYFKKTYYGQFGPLAICVELLIAACYLYIGHKRSNFALALFAFTALLDIIFKITGLNTSGVPVYGMVLFFTVAIVSLWIAFTNVFDLGRITLWGALTSFILGSAVEFYFTNF